MKYKHIPVLLDRVVEMLDIKPNQNYIDCTLGGAGYTVEIAKRILPKGKVMSFDLDELAIDNAKKIFKDEGLDNVIIVNDNFNKLEENFNTYAKQHSFNKPHGVVFDLGLSSAQLDDEKRGISFLRDTPLNMAFGSKVEIDTERMINRWPEQELIRIIRDYGEEKFAKRIVNGIIENRKLFEIKKTSQLVEIINNSVPGFYKRKKIHPATKTFQAFRIATNDELKSLEISLEQALKVLEPGGIMVVVSYHSLEDRIVKNFIKEKTIKCVCPPEAMVCICDHIPEVKKINKKIIIPSEEEIEKNPRARSAKMRVIQKN